ncbi:hypothetical protein Dsin_020349 [Dipteronia sinensis]|uniref:RING-type E3 ubiquitin transferase n=1 Tax=Dipteronia sinensis TaxID=43782 RepID=A0AAE0AA85_9ROSI|nr:hypothetical protein Dsin_020349 [Dipteronia sinensis]
MSSPTTTSYWCYRCVRITHSSSHFTCTYCGGGFVEEMETEASVNLGSRLSPSAAAAAATAMLMVGNENDIDSNSNSNGQDSGLRTTPFSRRRSRRHSRDHQHHHNHHPQSFNPVIVLRGRTTDDDDNSNNSIFELYYDDGSGSGLRPIPDTILEFLMGSGFHMLLRQLSQIDLTVLGRPENLPASKAAIESMPTIEISSSHTSAETHCAVCKEAFELGTSAREMPCKHIYHQDCILPWLASRNSCPVCRQELPSEDVSETENPEHSSSSEEETTVGLSIWRLPGGGFAVGRYNGRRSTSSAAAGGDQRGLSILFTEMDGNETRNSPRSLLRRSWERHGGGGGGGGFRRVFRGLGSIFRRFRGNESDHHSNNRAFVMD